MDSCIFLLDEKDQLVKLSQAYYDSESLLQDLLEKYSELLVGEQIDQNEPRRWLHIDRELGVPASELKGDRWSLDHLFLDQDAIPTLIEIKRSTDTRIRREVIGQLLEYAANASFYWSVDKIKTCFENKCAQKNENADSLLAQFLEDRTSPEEYWQQVKTNLQAGRLRLIFVADAIPNELKTIVEFLNSQMEFTEVLALEIQQYKGEGLKTLVPRLIGQTAAAQQKKTTSGKRWDEASFMEEFERRNGVRKRHTAQKLLEWSKQYFTKIFYGKGLRSGSYVPVYEIENHDYYPFAVYTYGRIEIYFQWYITRPPFDNENNRLELMSRLNNIKNITLKQTDITRRPSIDLAVLETDESFKQFCDTYSWFIDKIKEYIQQQ